MNTYIVLYNQFLNNNLINTIHLQKVNTNSSLNTFEAAQKRFLELKEKDFSIEFYRIFKASNKKEALKKVEFLNKILLIEKVEFLKERYGTNKPIPNNLNLIFYITKKDIVRVKSQKGCTFAASVKQILKIGDNKEFLNWLNR